MIIVPCGHYDKYSINHGITTMPVVISLYQPPGFNLSNATYDNKSFTIAEDDFPEGIAFNPDGTRMYIVGTSSDSVHQYDLGTAWDVDTAVYNSESFSVNSQAIQPHDVMFKPGGLVMYIGDIFTDKFYQYDLGVAWDVTSAVFDAGTPIDVNPPTGSPNGFDISSDGTKIYFIDASDAEVWQYDLGTAWDVSTMSATLNKISITVESTQEGIHFNNDGTRLFVAGQNTDDVFQYDLSVAWDITTAVYNSVFASTSDQVSQLRGVTLSSDGKKMYIIDLFGLKVYQYSL